MQVRLKNMHDFHLANQIVKTLQDLRVQHNLFVIKKINLELGSIAEHGEVINPENLAYNIKLLMPDLDVEIKSIEGNYWKLVGIEGN